MWSTRSLVGRAKEVSGKEKKGRKEKTVALRKFILADTSWLETLSSRYAGV